MKLTKLEKYWILYDVGNSAFIMLVSTIIPIYFNYLAGNAGISEVDYLAYWGYADFCRNGDCGFDRSNLRFGGRYEKLQEALVCDFRDGGSDRLCGIVSSNFVDCVSCCICNCKSRI